MEASGYRLMDTLVYLQNDIENYVPPTYPSDLSIQAFKPEDIPNIIKIAKESFSAFQGHYHADPRLDPVKATEVYSSWAERCCVDSTAANHVLVAKLDEEIVGFRAIRINTSEQAEFILAGVAPGMRRRGISAGNLSRFRYRRFKLVQSCWSYPCSEFNPSDQCCGAKGLHQVRVLYAGIFSHIS